MKCKILIGRWETIFCRVQGCQMAYFQTQNPNLGKFLRVWHWKMLVYFMAIWYIFMAIWYILWPFGIFYGHLVYFMAI
jgi:hypothetical protein